MTFSLFDSISQFIFNEFFFLFFCFNFTFWTDDFVAHRDRYQPTEGHASSLERVSRSSCSGSVDRKQCMFVRANYRFTYAFVWPWFFFLLHFYRLTFCPTCIHIIARADQSQPDNSITCFTVTELCDLIFMHSLRACSKPVSWDFAGWSVVAENLDQDLLSDSSPGFQAILSKVSSSLMLENFDKLWCF